MHTMANVPPRQQTSKYLIPDYPLIVLPTLAVAIGLNKAILLQQIHYLLGKLQGKLINGHRWIHMTDKEWCEQFPFWSKNTIRRLIDELVADGLIELGEYNSDPMDHTTWYTLNIETIDQLPAKRERKRRTDIPNFGQWSKDRPRADKRRNRRKSKIETVEDPKLGQDPKTSSSETSLSSSETSLRESAGAPPFANSAKPENPVYVLKTHTESDVPAIAISGPVSNTAIQESAESTTEGSQTTPSKVPAKVSPPDEAIIQRVSALVDRWQYTSLYPTDVMGQLSIPESMAADALDTLVVRGVMVKKYRNGMQPEYSRKPQAEPTAKAVAQTDAPIETIIAPPEKHTWHLCAGDNIRAHLVADGAKKPLCKHTPCGGIRKYTIHTDSHYRPCVDCQRIAAERAQAKPAKASPATATKQHTITITPPIPADVRDELSLLCFGSIEAGKVGASKKAIERIWRDTYPDGPATAETVRTFKKNWFALDWRGKKGEPPEPHQVSIHWVQYTATAKGDPAEQYTADYFWERDAEYTNEGYESAPLWPPAECNVPSDILTWWQGALGSFRVTLNAPTFASYLSRARLVHFAGNDDKGTLYVSVPDRYNKERIDKYLLPGLAKVFNQHAQGEYQIMVIIEGDPIPGVSEKVQVQETVCEI